MAPKKYLTKDRLPSIFSHVHVEVMNWQTRWIRGLQRCFFAQMVPASVAELVDAHGSGSCRLSLWEFDSPPRHQR